MYKNLLPSFNEAVSKPLMGLFFINLWHKPSIDELVNKYIFRTG